MEKNLSYSSIMLARLGLLATLVITWQLGSVWSGSEFYISTPSAIGASFWAILRSGELLFHASITTVEALAGFLIGGSAGVFVGLILGRSRILADILDPFLTAIYSLPKVALAPLFVLWLGIGIEMKIVLAAVTVFFLVVGVEAGASVGDHLGLCRPAVIRTLRAYRSDRRGNHRLQ